MPKSKVEIEAMLNDASDAENFDEAQIIMAEAWIEIVQGSRDEEELSMLKIQFRAIAGDLIGQFVMALRGLEDL